MNNRSFLSANYLAAGQIVLGLCVLGCLCVVPGYFFSFDQGGISNYGTEASTAGLFVAGFGAATIGVLAAAMLLPQGIRHQSQIRFGLYALAILYVIVVASSFSYKLNEALRQYHEYAAIALFLYMILAASWLRFIATDDRVIKRVFIVFSFGFATAILTLVGILHILFTAQIICGTTFGYMAARSVRGLLRKPPASVR